MSSIRVDYDILNQKQTPAFYASSLATRPAFGFPGRIFIDTDTPSSGIYRDTGSAWVQVADPGAGTTGTLQQVTTNGSSTTVGLSTSGNGIGIGTTIPASNKLDIHSASGINATFNGTTTNNAALQLQNAGTGKWNIQNLYNAGANSFQVYDVLNSTARLTILNTGAATFNGNVTTGSQLSILGTDTGGKQLFFTGGTTKFNFMVAAQQNVDNGFEITPSTAVGGSTFTTPIFKILNTGAATFSSSVSSTIFYSTAAASVNSGISIEPSGWNGSKHRFSVPINGDASILSYNWNGSARDYASYGSSVIGLSQGQVTIGVGTGNPTTALTISSLGAATFSSSVTATTFTASSGGFTAPNGSDFAWGNGTTYIDGDSSNQFVRVIVNNTERLRVNSSGFVGIATTTIGASLQINGNAAIGYSASTPANTNGLQVNGRGNFLNATDNALFSLNSGGTLYTVGFSPNATANSNNTLTLTTAQTTWIYTGTGLATWTLPTPSGTNQMFWIKNAGTGVITLNAFSGTNIIDNSATSVSSITIAVGATALIQQDGNVKSYQLQ